MTRANKMLAVLVVATLGLWGCAQEHKKHTSTDPRVKALEQKNTKLEEDFRAVVATRDQLRKYLAAAEEEKARLGQQIEQLQSLAKERDELRQQVTVRTGERDALQTQFEQFRKGIRSLLGQADSASNGTPSQPLTAVAKSHTDEKS